MSEKWKFIGNEKARARLVQMAEEGWVTAPNGEKITVKAGLSEDECCLIHEIVRKNSFSRSLEVGCAYGISTLTICDAISTQSDHKHTAIDKTQSGYWRNVGLGGVEECAFSSFELLEEDSALALPSLVKDGGMVDFALIDGWHSFDHALIDFFYINRILRVGGIVALDDASSRSVNKVARYVRKYPCYELATCLRRRKSEFSRARKWAHRGRSVLKAALVPFPSSLAQWVFDASVLDYDPVVDNSSLVAFRKIREDDRDFWWCPHF